MPVLVVPGGRRSASCIPPVGNPRAALCFQPDVTTAGLGEK